MSALPKINQPRPPLVAGPLNPTPLHFGPPLPPPPPPPPDGEWRVDECKVNGTFSDGTREVVVTFRVHGRTIDLPPAPDKDAVRKILWKHVEASPAFQKFVELDGRLAALQTEMDRARKAFAAAGDGGLDAAVRQRAEAAVLARVEDEFRQVQGQWKLARQDIEFKIFRAVPYAARREIEDALPERKAILARLSAAVQDALDELVKADAAGKRTPSEDHLERLVRELIVFPR